MLCSETPNTQGEEGFSGRQTIYTGKHLYNMFMTFISTLEKYFYMHLNWDTGMYYWSLKTFCFETFKQVRKSNKTINGLPSTVW